MSRLGSLRRYLLLFQSSCSLSFLPGSVEQALYMAKHLGVGSSPPIAFVV
jgi:hypothetical protein